MLTLGQKNINKPFSVVSEKVGTMCKLCFIYWHPSSIYIRKLTLDKERNDERQEGCHFKNVTLIKQMGGLSNGKKEIGLGNFLISLLRIVFFCLVFFASSVVLTAVHCLLVYKSTVSGAMLATFPTPLANFLKVNK